METGTNMNITLFCNRFLECCENKLSKNILNCPWIFLLLISKISGEYELQSFSDNLYTL